MKAKCLRFWPTKRRDREAALRFLRRAMKRYGRPASIVTDRLQSYRAAMKVIGNEGRQKIKRLVEQPHRKLISTLPATGTRNGQIQGGQNSAEIRLRPCFDPQPFQPPNAISTAATYSNKPEPLRWPNGGNLQHKKFSIVDFYRSDPVSLTMPSAETMGSASSEAPV